MENNKKVEYVVGIGFDAQPIVETHYTDDISDDEQTPNEK